MAKDCLGIEDTTTGLWLIAINSDGTYSWGNPDNAICFPTELAADNVLLDLGEGFAKGRPTDRQPH